MRSMKRLRRYFPLVALIVLLTPVMYVPVVAEGQPQPDPAGIATGDRTTAVDAAGNSFVVPEPDKSDPDYAAKKKAYDDFQAQLTREPLAAKVADVAGHDYALKIYPFQGEQGRDASGRGDQDFPAFHRASRLFQCCDGRRGRPRGFEDQSVVGCGEEQPVGPPAVHDGLVRDTEQVGDGQPAAVGRLRGRLDQHSVAQGKCGGDHPHARAAYKHRVV